MNKYIDTEKLIAELRRQKHELELSIQSQGDYGQSCHIVTYENILSLITSLQQEQPEVDLEKEIDKFLNETGAPYVWCNDDEQKEWCNIIARHFYELGLNARKEK